MTVCCSWMQEMKDLEVYEDGVRTLHEPRVVRYCSLPEGHVGEHFMTDWIAPGTPVRVVDFTRRVPAGQRQSDPLDP